MTSVLEAFLQVRKPLIFYLFFQGGEEMLFIERQLFMLVNKN